MTAKTASLVRIVRDALGEAPAADRRVFAGILTTWVVVVALQLWDVSGRTGLYVIAELLGAVVLLSGVLLLALTWTLQKPTQRATSATPGAIILALPVLASVGGTCFGFAGAMYITRAFLGAEAWFVILMVFVVLGVLWLSLRLVADTTRSLYEWARDQSALAARAEAEAERARLAALQAQLNPHFLFNALNTVASLVATDATRAERTVENLSSVLRRTLERSATPMTSVDEELRFVREYLDIERERFGDRLHVAFEVDSASAALSVPTMSLQPLVENVIKHVVSTRLRGGRVEVTTALVGDRLRLSVADDGDGFAPDSPEGTGLGNLRRRLRAMYGETARLNIESTPTGTRVRIEIPTGTTGTPGTPGTSGTTRTA